VNFVIIGLWAIGLFLRDMILVGVGVPRDSYEETGSPFRIDKVGIGNLGTKEIEIVSVEIKKSRITHEAMKQASRYFIFSHKVYVASPYKTITRNDEQN